MSRRTFTKLLKLGNKVAKKLLQQEHHAARYPLPNVVISSGRYPIELMSVGVFVFN